MSVTDKIAMLVGEGRALVDKATAEGRDFTTDETRQYEGLMARVETLKQEPIDKVIQMDVDDEDAYMAKWNKQNTGDLIDPVTEKPVRIVEPFEELSYDHKDHQVGRMICGMLDGRQKRNLSGEERAILSAGSDTGGGFTIPDDTSEQWLAVARNQTKVAKACRWVQMPSSNLTLVGIDSDPTATFVGEGKALPNSDPTFRAITLDAKTVGVYTKISKKLVMSAGNAAEKVEESLQYAVANAIDSAILTGAGDVAIPGIAGTTGVGTNDLASATDIDADNILDAIATIKSENNRGVISAFYNSDTAKVISKLKDGNGRYLSSDSSMPRWWKETRWNETNVIMTASSVSDFYIGDYSEVYYGTVGRGVYVDTLGSGSASTDNATTQLLVFVRAWALVDIGVNKGAWHYIVQNGLVS